MNTILILGVGRWQMPIISKAKNLGLRVVAADAHPDAPGFALSDIPIVCDIRDANVILQKIRNLKIQGVLCDQTEVPLMAASDVAAALGLPHTPKEVLLRAMQKPLMRECWERAGVFIPKFKKILDLKSLQNYAKEIGFPLITKPANSCGSQGVRVSECESDLPEAFQFAFSHTKSNQIIAEEYVLGREYTVEAFSNQGVVHLLAISQKTKPESNYQVSTLLEYPPDLSDADLLSIENLVKKAVASLGITDGPSHSEVIFSKTGPVMVETAARGGGFRISSDIIQLASGFDHLAALISLALGEEVIVPRILRRAVTLGFFQTPRGRVQSIRGVESAFELHSLHSLEMFVKPGDQCHELSSDRSRAGYFILSDENKQCVREETAQIYERVQIDVEPIEESKCHE